MKRSNLCRLTDNVDSNNSLSHLPPYPMSSTSADTHFASSNTFSKHSSQSPSLSQAPISIFNSNRVHSLWSGRYLSFTTELETYNHVCDKHIPELTRLPMCLWQPFLYNTTAPCGFKFTLTRIIVRSGDILENSALSIPTSACPLPPSAPLVMGKETVQRLKQHLLIHFSPSLKTIPCPVNTCQSLFRNAKAVKIHCMEDHGVVQNLPERAYDGLKIDDRLLPSCI